MTREAMTRTVVESIVTRGIRNIGTDPRRSIRRLVDLGEDAAKTPFQRSFFALAQRMLRDDDSPYYELVERAVRYSDPEKLKTVGINFGWNCLTAGAATIRRLEAEQGHNIPWCLTLHMSGRGAHMDAQAYKSLLKQGRELGIFAYILDPAEDGAAVETALELVEENGDCVFFMQLPADYDSGAGLPRLAGFQNLALGVDSMGADWERTVERLREAGCIYLPYRTYATVEEAEEITSGAWLEGLLPHAGIAAFCIAEKGCPPEVSRQVYRYILESRIGQRYPTLPVDFYRDIMSIDQCISEDECFVGVLPDGTVTEFSGGSEAATGRSLENERLQEVLRHFVK